MKIFLVLFALLATFSLQSCIGPKPVGYFSEHHACKRSCQHQSDKPELKSVTIRYRDGQTGDSLGVGSQTDAKINAGTSRINASIPADTARIKKTE